MKWNFWIILYKLTILSRTDKHYFWFIRVYGHVIKLTPIIDMC